MLENQFPILKRKIRGHRLVYLDNAATTQKPVVVLEAMDEYYRKHNANIHRGIHTLSVEATDMYEGARDRVQKFLGAASSEEIVFTGGDCFDRFVEFTGSRAIVLQLVEC